MFNNGSDIIAQNPPLRGGGADIAIFRRAGTSALPAGRPYPPSAKSASSEAGAMRGVLGATNN